MSRETHIPAKPTQARENTRVPLADGNKERTQGSGEPSRQRPQTSRNDVSDRTIVRLKTRPQFLAAAKGPAIRRGLVVVQTRDRRDDNSSVGAGFTATKKIGKAVVRNRAKRRLREAARLLLPLHGQSGWDYVFIARNETAVAPWSRLLDDVETALVRLARGETSRPNRSRSAKG